MVCFAMLSYYLVDLLQLLVWHGEQIVYVCWVFALMTRQKMSANLESFTSGVRLVVGLHPEPSESPSHRSVQHDDAPGSQHVWIHQNNHLGPDGNQMDLCFLAFSALLW